MKSLPTATLLVTLFAVAIAFTDPAAGFTSPVQPVGVRLVKSGDTGQQMIFLRDGRTIQAEKTERPGGRMRVETRTRRIDLPSSAVLSIHRMESPSGSPSGPPPADM